MVKDNDKIKEAIHVFKEEGNDLIKTYNAFLTPGSLLHLSPDEYEGKYLTHVSTRPSNGIVPQS